jgi:hypothetical protein
MGISRVSQKRCPSCCTTMSLIWHSRDLAMGLRAVAIVLSASWEYDIVTSSKSRHIIVASTASNKLDWLQGIDRVDGYQCRWRFDGAGNQTDLAWRASWGVTLALGYDWICTVTVAILWLCATALFFKYCCSEHAIIIVPERDMSTLSFVPTFHSKNSHQARMCHTTVNRTHRSTSMTTIRV